MKLGAFTNYKYCYNLFNKQFYCHMTQLDKKSDECSLLLQSGKYKVLAKCIYNYMYL